MSTKRAVMAEVPMDATARDALKKSRPFHILPGLLACLLAGVILGCTVTQDYRRPTVDLAYSWRVDYEEAADLANTAWWEHFDDPVLNQLINSALNENKDLRMATARVEEFAARLQAVRSDFYPDVYYKGGAHRDKQSLERPVPFLTRGGDRTNATYHTTVSIGWELDVWGRVRRATEAARADMFAVEENRQAVILTLVSAVATAYVELLALDKQLQISQRTLASREEWLRLFENKSRGGQISNLELAQIRSAYEQAAAYIPTLERRIVVQENAISVLLGRGPGKIRRGKTLDTLAIPEVPQGIPSNLLERRPDIRQREQHLIAANARIGVVRTQYFPTLSLTGLFGYASSALSDLFQGSANLWQIGGAAIGPIFSAGRIKGEIRQAEAQQEQLLNEYLLTVQSAFREMEDSLVTLQKLRELREIQSRHIRALKDYVHFSRSRYDAGYSSYLEVLDAERNLYAAEISFAQTQNDIFAAMVSIYKAMGGGWLAEAAGQIGRPMKDAQTGEATRTGEGKVLHVRANRVNVRSGPGTGFPIVTNLDKGAQVLQKGYSLDWIAVEVTASGHTGWIHASLLTRGAPQEHAIEKPSTTGSQRILYVRGDRVHVRSGPGTDFEVVSKLSKGTKVMEMGVTADWIFVEMPATGETGWIHASLLSGDPPQVPAAEEPSTPDSEQRLPALPSPDQTTSVQGSAVKENGEPSDAPSKIGPERTLYVRTNRVHVRNGPSTDFLIVGKLNRGTRVVEIGATADWVYVEVTATGESGWIHTALLSGDPPQDPTAAEPSRPGSGQRLPAAPSPDPRTSGQGSVVELTGEPSDESGDRDSGHILYVRGNSVHVRSGPGTDFPVIGKLNRGTKVIAKEPPAEWVLIEVPATGETGWIHASLLSQETRESP